MHEHNEPLSEVRIHANCYKCGHDHVHFEFANMMMTFTLSQFMTISEMIGKVREEILAEHAAGAFASDDGESTVAELVM